MKKNLPNILVIIRLLMAALVIAFLLLDVILPFASYPQFYVSYASINVSYFNFVALFIFILAALTDWLDGYLARKWNVISVFGKIFDPLADKILVNSVLIIFTVFGRIPIWITILFITRDFLVDGLRIHLSTKSITLSAKKWGKLKTLFQFIGLIVLFIIFSPRESIGFNYNSLNGLSLIPLGIGLGFSIFSGFSYYYEYWNEIF